MSDPYLFNGKTAIEVLLECKTPMVFWHCPTCKDSIIEWDFSNNRNIATCKTCKATNIKKP